MAKAEKRQDKEERKALRKKEAAENRESPSPEQPT
jgi:hypothetical protein